MGAEFRSKNMRWEKEILTLPWVNVLGKKLFTVLEAEPMPRLFKTVWNAPAFRRNCKRDDFFIKRWILTGLRCGRCSVF